MKNSKPAKPKDISTQLEIMNYMYSTVDEWNSAFDVPVLDNAIKRIGITVEEVLELSKAKTRKDEVDALVDILWTVAGSMIDYGIPASGFVDAVSYAYSVPRLLRLVADGLDNEQLKDENFELSDSMFMTASRLIEVVGFENAKLAVAEVRQTNFDKMWTADECAFFEVRHPGWTCSKARDTEARCYVVRDENGKIKKPPAWKAPQFSFLD